MDVHLEDVGQAKPVISESRTQCARRYRIVQLCLDLADELAVLLIELDPDLLVTGAPRRNTR